MKTDYAELLPKDFASDSKVWIYQSDRKFAPAEENSINKILENFSSEWHSHGTPVKGFGRILNSQFVVLIADESATGVSGCSTDSSVRLIKELEQNFNLKLFDWQSLAFLVRGEIVLVPLPRLQAAIDEGFIQFDTPFFCNTVKDLKDLKNDWLVPAGKSWLIKKVSFSKSVS